ncbi:MAG: EAL domain-containing protein [Bryobacterales bacterium]|nr:EAL domain-containing protein [Bryobacterales bacterium]
MTRTNRLLVVDDEALNRDMLSRRLERSGYRVVAAENGQQALEAVRSGDIDLVLLDHMMPGMSGVEVLRLLRATYSPDQLPVIMVTALNESTRTVEAFGAGANDYGTKPVDYPVALARIHSQLARKQAGTALRESQERYSLAVQGLNDGLWDWDLLKNTIYYSPPWKALLGYQDGELGDSPEEWFSRVHAEDRPGLREALRAHVDGSSPRPLEFECRMLHRNGSERWMLVRGAAARGPDGKAVRMAGSQSDITHKKIFDPLTGLPNRLLFSERLARALDLSRSDPEYVFAVLFLDLDRFKLVNDSLGHAAGDQLLVQVAGRLRQCIRGGASSAVEGGMPVIARMGGDEFAVLLEDIHEAGNASRVAERVLRIMRTPFDLDGKEVFCTLSLGIASNALQYASAADLLRDADTAMYRAKALGKARYAVFDQAMRAEVVARLDLENDLRRAIENQELVVHYQPKVQLSTNRVCGFEALVRWRHPVHGLVPPAKFIPLAEETGLIIPIGLWVTREACLQMRRWQEIYPRHPALEMSVNLSVRQFRQPDLVEQVSRILEETGLPGECLQLELTESVVLDDFEAAVGVLNRLKALGVGLKMDDFGTGYSCLGYLCRLPFNALKIDRSFTAGLEGENGNSEIIKTIMAMAGRLGLEVVAEGVENREQAALLQEMGCQFGQGYYFARPMEPSAIEKVLASS